MIPPINKSYRDSYETFFKEILKFSPQGTYDESALPSYTHNNRLMSWLFWQRINAALDLAGDLKEMAVLDFGCGGGITFKHLKDQGCSIAGCDNFSYSLVEKMCHRFQINASIYKDISDIKDKKFDIILALDVLEHIDSLEGILNQFGAVSNSKTKLILSGPTENFLYKAGRMLAGFSGHYHVRNIYQIEEMLMKRGWRRLSARSLYFPFTLFRVTLWKMPISASLLNNKP